MNYDVNIYLFAALMVYVGLCFGRIAAKHGKNPLLYGIAALISPINLIILGIWAFGKGDAKGRESD